MSCHLPYRLSTDHIWPYAQSSDRLEVGAGVKGWGSVSQYWLHLASYTFSYLIFSKVLFSPGWCGSDGWALSHAPRGRQSDSRSGNMPGFQARLQGVCRKQQPMFLSLYPCPLFLKLINTYLKSFFICLKNTEIVFAMCVVLPWGLLLGKAPHHKKIIIALQPSEQLIEEGTTTFSILQVKKLRLSKLKWLPLKPYTTWRRS